MILNRKGHFCRREQWAHKRGGGWSSLERVRSKGMAYECVTVCFCDEGLGQWKGVVEGLGNAFWFYGSVLAVW